MLLYVAAFALGAGPIPWVVLSEILPPRIKGPAASLATAAGWLGNLAVTLTFDSLLGRLGVGGAYLLYALLNGGGAWYVSSALVETKMKTLQVGGRGHRPGGGGWGVLMPPGAGRLMGAAAAALHRTQRRF
jgi:hypothetical protein